MKKLTSIIMAAIMSLLSISCANAKENNNENTSNMNNKKFLVAFFSRADENYNVGKIEKGNTQIMAEMIAKETGADTFHIQTVKPYPAEYIPCINQAKEEKNSNARPAIVGDVNVEDYDVIFIGYPNWWGEPPMALYTFIEKHNWQGKTIIPFITHEGSGFGGTDRRVSAACKGASALKGLAIQGESAQNSQASTLEAVKSWLKNLNF